LQEASKLKKTIEGYRCLFFWLLAWICFYR
jgi:hypothetical protein